MENQNTDQSLFDLNFDENVKQNLKGVAVWAGMAAIVSLTGSILGFINYFVQKSRIESLYRQYEGFGVRRTSSTSNLFSAVISLVIGIVLFSLLYKFSRSTKSGIDSSQQGLINEGLGSLASYFKVIGVLMIIAIAFFVLAFLAGLGGGFD